MYYDFFVKIGDEEEVDKAVVFLKKHGFVGACFFRKLPRKLPDKFRVLKGVELVANSLKELKNKLKRSHGNFIVLKSKNYSLTKVACQRALVDAVNVVKINDVIAKFASLTKVSLLVDFNLILKSKGNRRSKILAKLSKSCEIAQKKGMPIIIGSGATNFYELRALSNLLAFSKFLGIREYKKPFYFAQREIIRREEAKEKGKYIMPGVVVE